MPCHETFSTHHLYFDFLLIWKWTKISSPETIKIFGCCLCLNLGNIFSNCLGFCTRNVFFYWSPVNIAVSIRQKYFVLSKYAITFNYFPTFETSALSVTVIGRPDFLHFLLCASHIFFLSTNKLSQMIIYQTRKLSPIQLKPAVAKWPSFVQLFIY